MKMCIREVIAELHQQLHHLMVYSKYGSTDIVPLVERPPRDLARCSVAYKRCWSQDELYQSINVLEKIYNGETLPDKEHYAFKRAINYMKDIIYVSQSRVAELERFEPLI